MEKTTMTNTTQISRVRFACPQIADRSNCAGPNSARPSSVVRRSAVGVGTAFQGTGVSPIGFGADLRTSTVTPVPAFYAPMHKALAFTDVDYRRSWSPPV